MDDNIKKINNNLRRICNSNGKKISHDLKSKLSRQSNFENEYPKVISQNVNSSSKLSSKKRKHKIEQNSFEDDESFNHLKFDELDLSPRKKQEELMQYRYGNFPAYYGYRNQSNEDVRLSCMKMEWFKNKDVLDIGCNAGHLTLTLARDFEPRRMIGIDIDNNLIKAAQKNVHHYMNPEIIKRLEFPLSLILNFGPAIYPIGDDSTAPFPHNVFFVQCNYVLESDEELYAQEPAFDTILCLSILKWIHLNWGDAGIKRMFHRMYAQLNPGGHLILEYQPWSSYANKRKISEVLRKNYNEINFFPEEFNEYLLKEVGFSSFELIDVPNHEYKGFCRPIYLFTKGTEEYEMEDSTGTNHEEEEMV